MSLQLNTSVFPGGTAVLVEWMIIVSSIVKFFVATRVDAIDALNSGPVGIPRVVTFGNFDVEEALLDWEAHLTGRSFQALVNDDLPETVAESEDGPIVLSLSATLLDALSDLSTSRLEELAEWWVVEKEDDGVGIDPSVSLDILRALVNLVRQERESQEGLYCWTG